MSSNSRVACTVRRRAHSRQTGSVQLLLRAVTTMLLVLLSVSSMAALAEMTAQTASQIIDGCATYAKTKGQSHAIVVVDGGGHVVAALRMDGNPPGVKEFALQKAVAVAHWHFATAQMESAAKDTPGFAAAPNVVTVPGGIPVYSADGKQFIGAVGVSGEAPADDVACAEAGVRAAGLSLKHN